MAKLLTVSIGLAMAFSTAGWAKMDTLRLVDQGKSVYSIVLPADATAGEKRAGDELQKSLRDISGATLPILTDNQTLPDKMILVGEGNAVRALRAGIDVYTAALGPEGYVIKTVGPHLVIAGQHGPAQMRGVFETINGKRRFVSKPFAFGTLYGVYAFLEQVLGCRWYTSTVDFIPKKPTILLPALNVVQRPDFEYRNTYYHDAFDPVFNDHLRRSDPPYDDKVHTFCLLVPEEKYLKTHPEYFALINGRRSNRLYSGGLCLTNPDVLKIATATVFEWIRANPTAKTFSVSQNDTYGACQCERCRAVDAEEGSPAGLLLRFVNAIAAAVAQKYPDISIDTLAYQYTEEPPRVTRPGPNVRIRLCPISVCETHPYDRCSYPPTVAFMNHLRGWRKLTPYLDLWHYSTAFNHFQAPLMDFEQLQASFAMYKAMGVSRVFVEGNDMPGPGGFMDELKTYLIAKLLWDTRIDLPKVTADFLAGYFGKAGPPINQWLILLQDQVHRRNLHGSCWPGQDFRIDHPGFKGRAPLLYCPLMTAVVIAQSDRLFDEAEKLADTPAIKSRVRHARLSVEYVKVMNQIDRALDGGRPEAKAAARLAWLSFIEKCRAQDVQYLALGEPIAETRDKVLKRLAR